MKNADPIEEDEVPEAAAPRLHAILCLGADFDLAYIPHLCRHYGNAVDSWFVLLHSNDPDEGGDRAIEAAQRNFTSSLIAASSHAALVTRTWRGEFGPYTKIRRLNALAHELVPEGDWVLYQDADELVKAPEKLRALAARCQAQQQPLVYGQMVDRFAPDKKPRPIDDATNLFAKFPLQEDYTGAEVGAWTHKACLMRYEGKALLRDCHDSAGELWSSYRKSDRPVLTIWHFKWVDTTRDKLKHRVGAYRRQKIGWWPQLVKSLADIYDEDVSGDASGFDSETSHPYARLEARSFWKTGVASGTLETIWKPKWQLQPQDKVVTFGSCFARHLGPALRDRGFTWLETEPPPYGLSPKSALRFGYGHFSCRTGSLATPTALRQWLAWALGDEDPPDEHWTAGERFIDPFRPSIEPDGFLSLGEMLASRQQTLTSLRRAVHEADVFLFTLGMTESWVHDPDGWVYPACPGTAAGRFDPGSHRQMNQSFDQVREALLGSLERLWAVRPGLRVLLTVSPVPLTATVSDHHVLVATTRSKATLRAVAGEVADARPVVDYFPSFELVSAPKYGEPMFASNRRSVSDLGVSRVMDSFFAVHGGDKAVGTRAMPQRPSLDDEAQCDDAWAEAFAEALDE